MSETFAKKYWKEFEELSLEFIKSQYKDSSAQCVHTSFIKDGGFDGSLSINLTKQDSPFVHNILSLIEAKLRTESNVNIHDFAASIIAAYNSSAHILYVISNKNFTDETYRITDSFSKKVNLIIHLINGKEVMEWIQKNRIKISNAEFYNGLISSIELSTSKPNKTINKHKIDQESTLIITQNDSNIPEKIFGENVILAKEKIYNIISNLEHNHRLVVLYGPSGTGKTTVVNNIAYEIQKNNFIFSILDGESFNAKSLRTIYLWVLESLWGIDPTKAYSVNNIADFVNLICNSSDTNCDDNIKQVISDIFEINNNKLIEKSDLYTAYLLRYLEQILKKRRGNNRSILAFRNLHRLDNDSLEFLLPLIKCLKDNKVGLIIELDSLNSISPQNENWKTFHNLFKHFSKEESYFEMEDFTKEDAIEYLCKKIPGLSLKYYEYIIKHIGLRPAFLKYAIDWLNINRIVVCNKSKSYYTIAKPNEFFNGITPNQNIKIIEDIFRYYQSPFIRNNEYYIAAFEATILMDGSLKYEYLECLFDDDKIDEIKQDLLDSGMYYQTNSEIIIKNSLVFNAIKRVSLSSYRQSVAKKLYKHLCRLDSSEFIESKKSDLLEELKEWTHLYSFSLTTGYKYFQKSEYQKSIKFFSKCRKCYPQLVSIDHYEYLKILYSELFAFHKIGLGAQQKELFNVYKTHLKMEKRIRKNAVNESFIMLEKMFIARLSSKDEQYDKAVSMMKYAKQEYGKIPVELYVESCFVFALIEKKYISLDSAIDFLEEEKNNLPDSITLNIEFLSHKAAKYLNSKPEKALQFYNEIVQYSGLSKHYTKSIGHAYVDILTCYLLLENWEAFEESYEHALEYVKTNALIAEEGRIYNLDGIYFWIKKEMDLSRDSFMDSQFYLGLAHNINNLVIAKINYIGMLIEYMKCDEAILECSVASQLLFKAFSALFQQVQITKNYKIREYIGLLTLINYCRMLHQEDLVSLLLEKTSISEINEHYRLLSEGIYPKDVFENTCIVHSGIIALTR